MHSSSNVSGLGKRLGTAGILLGILLTGCVSETTGGFNVEASTEQAAAAYVQLAQAHYNAGDIQSARHNLDKARKLDDRHPGIYDLLAMIQQWEGDSDLAQENFQRAIRLDRDDSRVRNNYAALLFSQGLYAQACDELALVTQDIDYPGRAIAFENLGRSALRLERKEQAMQAFTRALQLNPDLYVSALELATLRASNEQWDPAWQLLQQYLQSAQLYNVPYTPQALLTGIQIGDKVGNAALVEDFSLILTTLYQQSPEYAIHAGLTDAN